MPGIQRPAAGSSDPSIGRSRSRRSIDLCLLTCSLYWPAHTLFVRRPHTSEHYPCLITTQFAHIVGIALEYRLKMLDSLCLVLAVAKPNLRKCEVGLIVS